MNFTYKKSILKTIQMLILFGTALLFSIAAAKSPLQNNFVQNNASASGTSLLQNSTQPVTQSTETTIATPDAPTEIPTISFTVTPTPFPDWAMTSKDTNGLLFAGILILLIIILGTLAAVAKNNPPLKS